MKKTLLGVVVASAIVCSSADADMYVGVTLGNALDDFGGSFELSVPAFMPQREQDELYSNKLLAEIKLGWVDEPWFAEVGYTDLGHVERTSKTFLVDGNTTYRSTAVLTESAWTAHASVGGRVRVGYRLAAFGRVGYHWYHIRSKESETFVVTDTPTRKDTTTTQSRDERMKDWAPLVGAGLIINTDGLSFTIEATRYGGVRHTTYGFGLLIPFQ